MADIEICILDFLERKGYERTARIMRKESKAYSTEPLLVKLEDVIPHIERQEVVHQVKNEDYPTHRKRPLPGSIVSEDRSDSLDGLKTQSASTPAPGATCRAFIGNLSFKITEAKIMSFFADCGDIASVDWVTDKETGKFYGSAFVNFVTPDGAIKALSKNGKRCLERPIRVNLANERTGPSGQAPARKMAPTLDISKMPHGCKILFMGNLSFDVTESNIRSFFASCGNIHEVRFALRSDGEFKGCGFIEFENSSAVENAAQLHGQPLLGRPIRLDFA